MIYAQIINGYALNLVSGESKEDALAKSFVAEWVANEIAQGRDWIAVPEDTKPGAKDNGDGTFTNPIVVPRFRALSKAEFQAHYSVSGSDLQTALDNWPTA